MLNDQDKPEQAEQNAKPGAPIVGTIHLPPHERIVLDFLAKESSPDECCWSFNGMAKRTGLDRTQVKRAARKLARRGLAKCYHGLWTDDGTPAGSGYAATDAGKSIPLPLIQGGRA